MAEVDSALDIGAPNPHLNMAIHLVRNHLEGRISTASSAIAASGTPYATARRKLAEMQEAGLVEQRPRTRTGKSFSLHPSAKLMQDWSQLSDRILRMARHRIGTTPDAAKGAEYYFGGSYQEGRSIQPPQVLPEPLALPGGLRILVHGDPTFMVMESLKRQFEQVVGTKISQRAFSIDRLHEESLRNGDRAVSRYDIIAVDLPWVGEFVTRGILSPLDRCWISTRSIPATFTPPAGARRIGRGGPMAFPARRHRNCCSTAPTSLPRRGCRRPPPRMRC